MDRHRRSQKSESGSRMGEFPEDFDDVFFHNQAVEQEKRILLLRGLVYKKIKNAIIDRVSEYKSGEFPLEDSFVVEFETADFNEFQWAVVREELLGCGFNARFEIVDGKITTLYVPVTRTISLTETLDEKLERERYDHNRESDSEEYVPDLS